MWYLRILGQFEEISPGLFQNFMDGYRKPYGCPHKGSNSVVVMSAGSQSRRSQTESYG